MQRWRDDQEWKNWTLTLLIDAVNRKPQQGLPWERVHVRYNFHYPRRTLVDLDNLIGRMKPCLDGIKGRAFVDDNAQCVHEISANVQVIPKVKAGVVIDIIECQCSLAS